MIILSVSIDQANLIIKHLGNGPYVEVYTLIAELQRQAVPQLSAPQAPPPEPEGQKVP